MSPARLWRLLLVSVLAFFVVACKPYASFTVAPEPVIAGQVATFDASGTLVDPLVRNNTVTSYTWDFGDKTAGSGKTTTHTYAAAGTYVVKLTVKDKAGQVGTSTETLAVQKVATPTTTLLSVRVQVAGGVPLEGASVSLGMEVATTDSHGIATLSNAPIGTDQVVHVHKTGFVNQAISTAVEAMETGQELLVFVTPVKESISLKQIENAQTINAQRLGASITLPANALVNASGLPATGGATVRLTPWNIQGLDLEGMLGNGAGRDGQGNRTQLLSAGIFSVDIVDSNGTPLQIASGKTADIQLDMSSGALAGTAIHVGYTLNLWHFDETTGLWAAQGNGTVVASTSSPVGMALKATVNHFSTWSWSNVVETYNAMQVGCQDVGGVALPCSVVVDTTAADGSRYTETRWVDAPGPTTINVGAPAIVKWRASNAAGLIGQAQTNAAGSLIITLAAPTTDNNLACTLSDATPVYCDVMATIVKADGSTDVSRYIVPAGGGRITTAFDTTNPIQWYASSQLTTNAAGAAVRYQGSATSGSTGSVSIVLDTEAAVNGKSIYVSCDTTADVYSSAAGGIVGTLDVAGCSIEAALKDPNGNPFVGFIDPYSTTPQQFTLPEMEAGSTLLIKVRGTSTNGTTVGKEAIFNYIELTPGQSILLRMEVLLNDVPPT